VLKLSKLSDYSAVVMAQIARQPDQPLSAPELAEKVNLPRPTVSKTLKLLHKANLVISRRGVQGGYLLAKAPADIRVSDIIAAIDGPVAMTACSQDHNDCDLAEVCGVADNWQRVSEAIRSLLDSVTLEQLAQREPLYIRPPRAVSPTATKPLTGILATDA